MKTIDYYVVPPTISNNNLREAAFCLMKDASLFMGEVLQRLDFITDGFSEISSSLDSIAKALTEMAPNCAKHKDVHDVQKKEAAPSSPLSSPHKEGEESSKEEEEIIPPIIPPSAPEENFSLKHARAKDAQSEAVQCAQQETALRELEALEASFAAFWDAYDYKRNRERAWTAWKRLPMRERQAAMAGVAAYKADCERFQRPMAHASTYIHQRRWEDDFNSGLENADRINGKTKRYTHEDIRNMERQQRLAGIARVAADFRAGIV